MNYKNKVMLNQIINRMVSIRSAAGAIMIFFLCGHTTLSFAQKEQLDNLMKKFDRYRIKFSSEKIYGHFDQDLYLTGETMWFKLYLADASLNRPSDLSRVAYVEVLDSDNRPVLQTKVSMKDGFGNGSVFLPASLSAGNYTVRAYTNWMKNFDPEFYFHKKVSIINTFKRPELEKEKSPAKPEAQFFPEGGNLVYGLQSTVAIRIVTSAGEALNFQGGVINALDDTLATFNSSETGVAKFNYRPVRGQESKVWIQANEQRYIYSLPAPLEEGYVLQVKDSTESELAVKITSSAANTSHLYVVIHARNIVSMANTYSLNRGTLQLMVPKKRLDEGVSHITIFDDQLRPVCERLIFMPVSRNLDISVKPSQNEFGLRRKVTLDITAEVKGQPAVSNLSVAVYRNDSLHNHSAGNITNYMWLGSDLTQMPDLPVDFLTTMTEEKKDMLDDLMLTNGWRRFKWNSIINEQYPVITDVPEMRGHIIKGKVTRNGQPVQGVVAYLSTPATNIQLYGSTSTEAGDVKFEMKDFSGRRKIYVQPNLVRDSLSRVDIQNAYSEKFATYKYAPLRIDEKIKDQLTARSLSMQVQDIFYQDKGAQTRSRQIDTTAFYGKADATYYLDDYTRFPVMEEIMREYVPGVLVRKRRDGFHFINLDNINKGVFDEDPFIMLDGIPIFDADEIMNFDPLKVKKLEVVTRRYFMGVMSLPGIVSYTTYSGDLGGFQVNPKCVVLDYEGLQYQREYYSPTYETAKLRESRLPDQRNLLYWAPSVTTSNDGRQHLEFFTSDLGGDYRVVIEGISPDGFSGSTYGSFKVKTFDN